MTLYRNFASKDDLILAYLRESDDAFWQYFEDAISSASSPRDQILAFFRRLADYVTSPDCRGCPFINIAIEFPDPENPGGQVAEAAENLRRSAKFGA